MQKPHAILFDLDGTLLDTLPDLLYALNQLRQEHSLQPMHFDDLRPMVNLGSRPMLKAALGIDETNPDFARLREKFLTLYAEHIADATLFFPGIEEVLDRLDSTSIPWGIVTNKLTLHTIRLLKALNFDHRPACVVCGDTLSTYKPDPGPILHACELLRQNPKHCFYVGDSMSDMMASKAAGTHGLAALYGYIPNDQDPRQWQADGFIQKPLDLLTIVQAFA